MLGPIRQNGYVVTDINEAINYWITRLGVGPFFVLPRTTFSCCTYQGRETFPELSVAIGNCGDLQIELIQQLNDVSSYYTDFIRDHGPGLQHVAVWSENFDADRARFVGNGLISFMEGTLSHGVRVSLFETPAHVGTSLELMELLPTAKARMAFVREAAIQWDGSDPVRALTRNETITP